MTQNNTRYYIGIDPGVNTGYAVWDALERELVKVGCVDFLEMVKMLEAINPMEYTVIIEDPNLNAPTFFHKETDRRKREKISQNVGANKRDAQLLIQLCQRRGLEFQPRRPSQGKWSSAVCRSIIRQKISPDNSHTRDAVRLVWGIQSRKHRRRVVFIDGEGDDE